ncbi:MAG: hypothetical protein CMK83_03760 [Pseudomonadales bacterium]|jgi:hypothetical protein|uniref:hypothetical protein n=1 Tax=unclassified Ketobacter TaxID=2639109 RepID=UPI000C374A58|nr:MULTISPECIES: hypothetical protein [unclassified Ketobacter]MAA59313.1 hypothetical protein [Pseudomonadales bacterium]MEC8812491.1 hypothetical protein [Pseudomonadota bacterium]TNC89801.1 MAG: hypothetical protein CSH49_05885 [Alcanivorax sp.]HAU14188.1 hypothetical protein [Gammaproteobacteria bacterium]MAQ23313.1 hypothetical protein [Pseudomonadales bacterium]|tara:strand:- start:39 stop:551 length:513 start_codon:yes stop_codon:yes gene_type:complete
MKRNYDGEHPPIILDIEASGFGAGSYPIEVGFAADKHNRYCSLIRPFPNWTHWSETAQQIHGISRRDLEQRGGEPMEVALELNRRLNGKQIYSDGWVVDHPWLMTLFFAVNIEPAFQLSPIELIMTENQMEIWDDVHREVIICSEQQRHRASVDAWVIQQTWIKSHYMTQ